MIKIGCLRDQVNKSNFLEINIEVGFQIRTCINKDNL